ncbi:MAG: ABC transporter ATP-binding protein [Planctomycetes bacterium]|nr:ABC transporter ATP-binding protein [Planctomycetota bacterium]
MTAAISARQLAVTFRGRFRQPAVPALRPLDLDVAEGTILGILGPNGSGKTTLLRVLAGLQRPTTGSVQVLGREPGDRSLLTEVAWQPEGALPLAVLSATEFLQWFGCQLKLPDAEADRRAAHWLSRLGLQTVGRRAISTFSTGMQKRLALAAALLGEPRLLLLDEPTAGLDPLGSELVMQILQERAAAGGTVLLASHHLQEIERICSQVLVLQRGVVRARGGLDELLATGERELVIRGLDDAGLAALQQQACAAGATEARLERRREHLFALYRRLEESSAQPPGGTGS